MRSTFCTGCASRPVRSVHFCCLKGVLTRNFRVMLFLFSMLWVPTSPVVIDWHIRCPIAAWLFMASFIHASFGFDETNIEAATVTRWRSWRHWSHRTTAVITCTRAALCQSQNFVVIHKAEQHVPTLASALAASRQPWNLQFGARHIVYWGCWCRQVIRSELFRACKG